MPHRGSNAAAALNALDKLGAISLDTLIGSAAEVREVLGTHGVLEPDDICYPFVIRVGPRDDFDLVTVAKQMGELGFTLTRNAG